MKRLICLVLVLLVVGWIAPVMAADQIGLGGIWIKGAHSDSGKFAMENEGDNGWGINAFYDKDMGWIKKVSEDHAFGLDPGMDYKYLRWTKSYNKERTLQYRGVICKACQDYPVTTIKEQYRENEKVNSQILSGTVKPFWQYKDFRLFGIGGVGIEVEESDNANLAVTYGAGLQYYLSKHLGLTVSAQEVYSNPTGNFKRWDLVVANVLYRF